MTEPPFDAVVIGTGFGGAVAACRLTQAGKSVCVLERGRRYELADFPRPATRPDHLPHTARWLWALDCGMWDVKDLQGTLAVQAAGYGGGSLGYANVHLRAPREAFAPPTRHGADADGWPAAYSREELDRFYDVVAAALRVRPIPPTFIPAALVRPPLKKVEAMRGAAHKLERDAWFFLPPLAIDFDKCVMCGECIAGCQFQAKNTLDLNYLAAAERLGADVRTLAEVLDIRHDAADDGYTVTYHDHVTGDAGSTVRGRSVFLCAGSVNSTHLLLRSKDHVGMDKASQDHVGRRFFVNGDAIAMVYDTTPAPTPTRGPTIATSLLYNNRPLDLTGTRGDWFMVQDGGYPTWLEPVLGLFRSDFWLQRNRILTAPEGRAVDAETAARQAAEIVHLVETTARALLGVLDARRAYHDPSHAQVLASRSGLTPQAGARSPARGLGIDEVLPAQIHQIIDHARKSAHSVEERQADAVSKETLDQVEERLIHLSGVPKFIVENARGLVERHRLPATLEALHRYFLKAPPNTAEPFSAVVLWPLAVSLAQQHLLGRRPNDHAFLMLVMGIDAAPGQLYLDDAQRLLAYWDLPANARLATMQERLMHDVAAALEGEMRLNPDATVRQRPVTVHNLGGCAMSDRPEDGVTDPDGKVWGTRALYVLDGAAMPGSLGANPSATIAAIAERNVRRALEDPASPIHVRAPVPLDPPLPGGPSLAEIRRQLGHTPAILDPIAQVTRAAPEPEAQAVGLTFTEVMQGFHGAAGDAKSLPIRANLVATIDDLSAFLVDPRRPVAITGTVRLVPGPAQPEAEYAAKGTLELLKRVEAATALGALFDEGIKRLGRLSELRVAAHSAPAAHPALKAAEASMESLLRRLEATTRRYEMEYTLDLTPQGGAPRRDRFIGVKKIYGGPGLAPWTETTTLYVTLVTDDTPVSTGEMHVHIADLLKTQLPSFRVTGSADDVRIAWAYARFFRFFLGTLRQVYLPHLQTIDPFADRGP